MFGNATTILQGHLENEWLATDLGDRGDIVDSGPSSNQRVMSEDRITNHHLYLLLASLGAGKGHESRMEGEVFRQWGRNAACLK